MRRKPGLRRKGFDQALAQAPRFVEAAWSCSGAICARSNLGAPLRHAFPGLRSDYGSARIALVLLGLFYSR
jgi:hypothetical protein